MMNRKEKSKRKTLNEIQKIKNKVENETNACLSKLKEEDYKRYYHGYSGEISMLESDIKKHHDLFVYLKDNYEYLQNQFCKEQFHDDHDSFKKDILKTQTDLNYLKKKLLN
jgi:hypothetical protein